MSVGIYILRIFFVLFLLYTLVYLIQWGIALYLAIHRLSRFSGNRQEVRKILPDSIAENYPVSIIIPAHNEDKCICDTIEVLLKNDYPGLKVIVVDDGSDDNTFSSVKERFKMEGCRKEPIGKLNTRTLRQICRAEAGDKELLLISKDKGGKADALNCGLNFCSSRYCVVLDADTRISPDSIRILASRFLLDKRTIVCAGSIGPVKKKGRIYSGFSLLRKLLVRFQQLEYLRTFYMQRLLFEQINANVIVSGAFAMFDAELLKSVGGYRVNTIGEDMEITMRLHALCQSQKRPYRIAYAPEAQCYTQFPFRYRDFIRQRRRWHIGMIQSFREHSYMLANHVYGWAGIVSGTFLMLYEMLAPFIELLGFVTLIFAFIWEIMDPGIAAAALLSYTLLTTLNQLLLLQALQVYKVADISFRDKLVLGFVSLIEFITFHPLNMIIKIAAVFMRRFGHTWEDIRRSRG